MPLEKDGPFPPDWDYLVITASNDRQADAYREQIELRAALGLIRGAGKVLVVPDPGNRRVGSGGSTVHCLLRILDLEMDRALHPGTRRDTRTWAGVFGRLRILIVHAGGDSRRLPPYGPYGKIFVPIPGNEGGALGTTLFDRLLPVYLRLPRPAGGGGQAVVASGDVLLDLDAASVVFQENGVTGVGALVRPEIAANHGVYCREESGEVRQFLQKPSPAEQAARGAIDGRGRSVLDIGILNLAPEASVRLLELAGAGQNGAGERGLRWRGPLARAIEGTGLDIYREICCALGRGSRPGGYIEHVRGAGSAVEDEVLRGLHRGLRGLPFRVHVVPRFRFLHFGTLPDLLDSGRSLAETEAAEPAREAPIVIDSVISGRGAIRGRNAWVEGCRIGAPLTLEGDNLAVGLDVEIPLRLSRGAAVDLLQGPGPEGRPGWFVRVYSTADVFHRAVGEGARLCGLPLREWLAAMGAGANDVWPRGISAASRTVWNGCFFPFVRDSAGYREWLWLLEPGKASPAEKARWRSTPRFSFAEMAGRADLEAFQARRLAIRGDIVLASLAEGAGPSDEMSAAEIAFLVRHAPADKRAAWVLAMGRAVARSFEGSRRLRPGLEALGLSRLLHTTGSAIEGALLSDATGRGSGAGRVPEREIARALAAGLSSEEKNAFRRLGAPLEGSATLKTWPEDLKEAAFRHLGRTIAARGGPVPPPPKNVLRSDEIVWGRAPARLDLGGGWTDTPPYSLERGGCVLNAAVDLNGQAPIQAYARIIDEPEIRINSIDHSTRLVVRISEDLLDYRQPGSQFSLAKAALALSGFAPGAASWPAGARTLEAKLRRFGGGIELTTLAAIPSGSGLGTSSIMGAVLMSVLGRMTGRPLGTRELFHAVLQLEQELTTGGGWQDQIGGVVEGVKMIETEPGLVPDPRVHFVPADLLDPAANGGRTLLYYTGIRRLAKNILHEVVGRYLDRDRGAMDTLARLRAFPPRMAEAMGTRDMAEFGRLLDLAWRLNVDLDPAHTTPMIDRLRVRIRPRVLGSKLLGAGGGGFLLIACASAADAGAVKEMLDGDPPNDRARFFDYSISRTGLVVTVC